MQGVATKHFCVGCSNSAIIKTDRPENMLRSLQQSRMRTFSWDSTRATARVRTSSVEAQRHTLLSGKYHGDMGIFPGASNRGARKLSPVSSGGCTA